MLRRVALAIPMFFCALAFAKFGERNTIAGGLRGCELRFFNPDSLHGRLTSEPANANDPDGFVTDAYPMSASTMIRAYGKGLFAQQESANRPGHPRLITPVKRGVMFLDPNDPDKGISRRDIRTMKKMRAQGYVVRIDNDFPLVLDGCRYQDRMKSETRRQWREARGPLVPNPTWITNSFRDVFLELHALGYAHSVEVYLHNQLVAGLFGLEVDGVFTGESMFYLPGVGDNAVKLALWELRRRLARKGHMIIDTEENVGLVLNWGGELIPRQQYLKIRQLHADLDLSF